MIKFTLKSYNKKKSKKRYLCLHCLQQLKISFLQITENDEYIIYLCDCGWRNDFEEDFSSFDDCPVVFTRVVINEFYTTQQCYPPVYERDVELLPEKTKDAVIDYLQNELVITYCKEDFQEGFIPHELFEKHYQGYLEQKYDKKTLLQVIRPLYLHAIRVRRTNTTEEQRKRYSDSIYQNIKSLDIKTYEDEIRKKRAQINIAKYFKNLKNVDKMDKKTEKWLSERFYQINDKTGFREGDLFESEKELRSYLTADTLNNLFPDHEFDQEELDDFYNFLINNKEKLDSIDLQFIE